MNHDITGLRERLFQTIDALKAGTIDIERAKVISDLSQVAINSAKVEVDFIRATDRTESAFLARAEAEEKKALPNGIVGVRRHMLKDD